MTGRRGVLPLALLIVAALVAGVAIALVRLGEEPGPGKAGPSPTAVKPTVRPTKTKSPGPTQSPTVEPTETGMPTQSPTQPTQSPTQATQSPTVEPTETRSPGGGGTQTPDGGPTPLAKTGGTTFPWLFLGALLMGLSALLGRLARRPG